MARFKEWLSEDFAWHLSLCLKLKIRRLMSGASSFSTQKVLTTLTVVIHRKTIAKNCPTFSWAPNYRKAQKIWWSQDWGKQDMACPWESQFSYLPIEKWKTIAIWLFSQKTHSQFALLSFYLCKFSLILCKFFELPIFTQ